MGWKKKKGVGRGWWTTVGEGNADENLEICIFLAPQLGEQCWSSSYLDEQ